MMNAVAPTIAADNSDRIAVAIAATIHDLSDSTGICVGMDTSAASPDSLVVCALPVLFDENQLAQKKRHPRLRAIKTRPPNRNCDCGRSRLWYGDPAPLVATQKQELRRRRQVKKMRGQLRPARNQRDYARCPSCSQMLMLRVSGMRNKLKIKQTAGTAIG